MVRSPLSAWLAEHIIELRFHYIIPLGYPLRTALVRFLPACRHIRHDFHDKPTCMLLSHNAALKSSLWSITSLTLINCNFPSFRIVLRVLGDITYLEKVAFWKIKWSNDQLTTADTVSDVCTGAFSHIRSVEMDFCTNNMAVPAWILAAASTQHSFTRRRTPEPTAPAQTWAIIKLFQRFLGDSMYNSWFDVKEATAGSDTAYISVQVVKSAPAANNNQAWSVRQIVLAYGPHKNSHAYFYSRDWSMIASLLLAFSQLQQFQVLCGRNCSEKDFRLLSDKIAGAVNNGVRLLVTPQQACSILHG
ncbi:uncharacterized protein PHACADRAFT_202660 [Phanerochaete carnosa HHB-10118-sp]|uniref:F-box domain-containing protein n=1 Tax=Phanerochaete carnosa (strain HHB-10118-sp) TaxID=650164 RepID=K5WEF3_PHACS|nr:uncharacterized protein PHACADRAFT_202660 [Phanerochaete carnosa HHB-10118-sp]EKM48562.1 hypothetical protein PHACADRAFT_202660 [Phanerochaete carnosa HHB-10118-sp]